MSRTYSHVLPARLYRPLPRSILLRAWALYRQRRHLAELCPQRLEDLGLDPAEARAESLRPVWDAPEYWRG